MTIFVQIAAYRDSELGPNIRDCLSKAKWPKDLRFGLCLQDKLDTDYGVDFTDSRIRLMRVPWQESRGVCWARSKVQSLYDGEAFTLQIDSHHRFAEHWDDRLLNDLERCESDKPILSTYPGSYDPITDKRADSAPNRILLSRFGSEGSLKRYPMGFAANHDIRPIPARMIAAGFLFTEGRFCENLPYDPRMYFTGEELSLTVRAFTHGYDIFHPQQNIVWHEYIRDNKPKHWFDHGGSDRQHDNKITQTEASDMEQFYRILSDEDSRYGIGSTRSVHDYERFAGVDLNKRVVHQKTRLGISPSTLSQTEWQTANIAAIAEINGLKRWFITIDLSASIADLSHARVAILAYYDRDRRMIDRVTIGKQTKLDKGLFEQHLSASVPPSFWVLSGLNQNNAWEKIHSEKIYDYRLIER